MDEMEQNIGFDQNNQDVQDNGDFTQRDSRERSRSRSPIRRSRSRSPASRDWKRSDRGDRDRDRSRDRDRDRDRDRRRDGRGVDSNARIRLYICNIPFEVRWQDLKDLFRQKLGQDSVTYVELYEGPDGKPTGHGVVEVRGSDTAEKAIKTFHRHDVKGRQIVVREEREKDRLRHEKEKQKMQNFDARDNISGGRGGGSGGGGSGLMSGGGGSLLGNMGPGNSMGGNMMGGIGGNSGGININLQMLSQLEIDPSMLTQQVFVANLDYKVSDRKLKDIFKMAGNVVSCELKVDKEGKSRGMGIVRFEHAMEAVQAISMFHNQPLYDRTMAVRMDKMSEVPPDSKQYVPNKIPAGLKTVGMGLGSNGTPLQNVSQIANALCLTNFSQLSGGGSNMGSIGNMGSNMGNMGSGMGMGSMGGNMGGMGNMGSGMGNMGGGMGNMGMGTGMGGNMGNMGGGMGGGMSNMGGSSMGGNMGMGSGMGGTMGSLGASMGGNQLGSGLMGNMGGSTSGMGGMGSMGTGSMGSGMGDIGMATGGMGGGMGTGLSSLGGGMSASLGLGDGLGSSGMGLGGMGGMGSGLGNSMGSMGGSSLGMGGGRSGLGRSRTTSGGREEESSSVFVRNLPFTVTWQDLKEKFRDCGDVRYTEIKMENGRSKGYGVVRFNSSDDARRAVNLMNGARIEGRQIEVRLEKN